MTERSSSWRVQRDLHLLPFAPDKSYNAAVAVVITEIIMTLAIRFKTWERWTLAVVITALLEAVVTILFCY